MQCGSANGELYLEKFGKARGANLSLSALNTKGTL